MTDGTRELIAKKWLNHSTNQATIATNAATLFPGSSAAGVGALAAANRNFTRFVEIYNDDSSNTVHARVYNASDTGSATNAATLGDRAVPPKTFRVFQVPGGGGQGMLSCIAKTGACVVSVNWGIGAK